MVSVTVSRNIISKPEDTAVSYIVFENEPGTTVAFSFIFKFEPMKLPAWIDNSKLKIPQICQ